MTALPATPLPRGPSPSAEIATEQGYVDWAYERLDGMLEAALDRENAGIHAAAALALWKMREARAKQIRAALSDDHGLVIGRLDMTDDETWYIGRHPVDGDDGRPAVVEWQAEFAKRFYQATPSFPAGIGRRRSIRMASRLVTGVSDETLVVGFVTPTVLPVVQEPPVEGQRRAVRPALVTAEPPFAPAPAVRANAQIVDPPDPEMHQLSAPAERLPVTESQSTSSPVPVTGSPTPIPRAILEETPTVPTPELLEQLTATELRGGDLLLQDLARGRTGSLEDIVATIQADQDRLVRAPSNVPLIIQGGPGTGKTIVGLHRAAWVLYQQRERLIDQSVLVVGPNRRFIDYIGNVLPSLGESDVRQATIDEIALDSLSVADRDRVKVMTVDRRDVARIKGDGRMSAVIRAAVWSGVTPIALSFGYGRFTLRLDEDQVDAVIGSVWQRGTAYRPARRELGDYLAQAFADEYVRRLGQQGSGGGRELRQLIVAARSHLISSGALAQLHPTVEPREVIQRLYEDRQLLEHAGSALTANERGLLFRSRGRGRSAWTAADLPLLDEAATCIRGETPVTGHVVVDEAQDLSPMQWRVLVRRTSQGSMTILGDLAQATSPWSPSSWTKVIAYAGLTGRAELAELTLGYRVPVQVMDFAAPLVAAAAPDVRVPHSFRSTVTPLVRRAAPAAIPRVAAKLARGCVDSGAVAIIAPIELHEKVSLALGDAVTDVTLLAPEASKGLEFDVVVVVEPHAIAGKTQTGLRLLYVTLTRATKELIVVHSKALPGGIGAGQRPTPPSTYPNPRNDDPWDNDAVHWLLDQPGGEECTRGVLMECLRRQPNQLARNRRRVDETAHFAQHHGVIRERSVRGGGSIVRLFRTDDDAPAYPACEAARRSDHHQPQS